MSALATLPHNLFCELDSMSVIHVHGEESIKYLQGQVTIDMAAVNTNNAVMGCHCDFKGKTWNIFYALAEKPTSDSGDITSVYLVNHKGATEKSLAELNKYGVFAKVDILDVSAQWQVFGLAGESVIDALKAIIPLPSDDDLNVVQHDDVKVITLSHPIPRYLVLARGDIADSLKESMSSFKEHPAVWEALDILAGIPNIQATTQNEFVPQMMNLHALNAISFDKGCYMGQEVVARTKYLGKNKRAAFILKSDDNTQLVAGDTLEVKVDENWRRGGTVLRSAALNQTSFVLAVLPNDTKTGDILRSKDNPDQILTVLPLPYSLED
ncbi:tRNA-modifying protein YgfZ [Aestuariibacter sp. AA17]|uniref:tRNA-modifying protein YgfZ n=1 Tax=Fluctibacter corallii TaxID=2984329 RepID=A0ABT3A3J7_9ALTE|nr:tRNA-modifying protein YgfZ [Aestuariibacter sp. AA17]MCV2883255.1 tRNA-modifying protein YgfZ [Aestuariibacter sp. AA17]